MLVAKNNSAFSRLEKIECVHLAYGFRGSSNCDETEFASGGQNRRAVDRVERMNLIQEERHFAEQSFAGVLAQETAQEKQIEQYLDCDGCSMRFDSLLEIVIVIRFSVIA